ncbi:MAG: hypothetical protein ACYDBQ_01240 [Thermoplasmatota archaeon]
MSALQRGDVIVCAFTKGKEGNEISLSPQGQIVILERTSAGKIDQRAPYVCTIKAVGPPSKDGTPRSYVAHIDHALNLRDYDVVLDANFERTTLTLGLKFPTKFASLRRREIIADVEEEYVPARNGAEEAVILTLSHGNSRRSMTLSREEALRRGLRFNHFVRVPPPEGPIDPAIHHPAPRPAPAGWVPTLMDHTGYLLQPTRILLDAVPAALQTIRLDAFLAMARRRILEIAAIRAYETIPLEAPDHVSLEHALTAVARLAFLTNHKSEARQAIAVAEARLAHRHAQHLAPADLATLLGMAGKVLHPKPDGNLRLALVHFATMPLGRNGGEWAPCNLDVRAGQVYISAEQARELLADHVKTARLAENTTAIPANRRVMEPLGRVLDEALSELAKHRDTRHFAGLRLEAIPPCVAYTLKAALRRGLCEAEAFNAGALLCRTGLPSARVNQALYGVANRSPGTLLTPGGTTSRGHAHPPTCRINKQIGICAWTCPGINSPEEYYAKAIQTPPAVHT